MKKMIMLMMICLILTGLSAEQLIVLNSGSQTLSLVNLVSQSVNNSFSDAGLYGNQVYFVDTELWLVNSGDNNIQKIDCTTGNVLKTIQLEGSVNPWNVLKKDTFLYISGMMSGKVYRINIQNDEISSIDTGISPEGMLLFGNELFVANTGFQYPDYLQGKIAVINLSTFTKTADINVSVNPQAMIMASDGNIHVMCTGNYASESGKIDVINPGTKEVVQSVQIGGSPNSIIESPDHKVYLADGMGAGFYVYDAVTKEIIHSNSNPYLPGGSKILFQNDKKLVLKTGNWVSNSHLEYINADESMIYDYSLGIGAVDLTFLINPSTSDEITSVKPMLIDTYPNPFKSVVQITSKNSDIKEISIYNLKGEKIKTLENKEWNGYDQNGFRCPSGVYFVAAKTNAGITHTKKITYLR